MNSQQALRFQTRQEADDWMVEHHQYGMVHPTLRGFIIVRFDGGRVIALTSPTAGMVLTEW